MSMELFDNQVQTPMPTPSNSPNLFLIREKGEQEELLVIDLSVEPDIAPSNVSLLVYCDEDCACE